MKKVAFYIESMIAGGAERVLIDLVNHMDPLKYEITIVSIFKYSIYDNYHYQFAECFNSNIHYKALIDNASNLRYRLFNYCYANFDRKKIYRKLIRDNFDIEVAFYEGLPTLFISNSANPYSKKYAWLHTDNTRLYVDKSKEYIMQSKETYSIFDKVIAVSHQVEKSFLSFFPEISVCTINNLIDMRVLHKQAMEKSISTPQNCITFLTVGRFTEVKGYSRLIEVLDEINKMGYSFFVYMIGNGELYDRIAHEIQEKGLSQYISMEGFQNNPYPYMLSADWLICSSFAEGLSTVAIEALSLGLPVVTTDCAGMRDILGDDQGGIICENTKEGLLSALISILSGKINRNDYVKGCAALSAKFRPEEVLGKIDVLLDEQ